MSVRPSIQALIDTAVASTGADRGWLLRLDGDQLVVVAAAGGDRPGDLEGRRRPIEATAGYVVSANAPAALQLRSGDEAHRGAGGADGIPDTVLAAPCSTGDEVDGVLEVVDSANGSFGFDEVEIVELLAGIAGAMLAEDEPVVGAIPTPDALAADLDQLAAGDPTRYAAVASVLGALLSR